MQASYGYIDGTGEYFITIDTDLCDGCEKCEDFCPEKIFAIAPDDYGKQVASVKDEVVDRISYICPGPKACDVACHGVSCQTACPQGAISHTWGNPTSSEDDG
jgi:ferredoxin